MNSYGNAGAGQPEEAAAAKKGGLSGMLGKVGLGGSKPMDAAANFAKDQAVSAAQDAAVDAIGEENPLAGNLAEGAIGKAGDGI